MQEDGEIYPEPGATLCAHQATGGTVALQSANIFWRASSAAICRGKGLISTGISIQYLGLVSALLLFQ
jgi:hypothetical protein